MSSDESYLISSADNSWLFKIDTNDGSFIAASKVDLMTASYLFILTRDDACLAINVDGWFMFFNSSTMS